MQGQLIPPEEVERMAREAIAHENTKKAASASFAGAAAAEGEFKECEGEGICQPNRRRSKGRMCRADKDDTWPPDLEDL